MTSYPVSHDCLHSWHESISAGMFASAREPLQCFATAALMPLGQRGGIWAPVSEGSLASQTVRRVLGDVNTPESQESRCGLRRQMQPSPMH